MENKVAKSNTAATVLSDSIYSSVVRSLYADQATLMVGVLCLFAAPLVLYAKTGDLVHLLFSLIFLVFGVFRVFLAQRFDRADEKPLTRDQYRMWEKRYAVIGGLYVSVLGLWVLIGSLRDPDPFILTMSTLTAICYMVGVIGRNFGSGKVVTSQTLIGMAFILTAVLLRLDLYYMLLGAFLLPFFAAIQTMSARLRNMLFRAEKNAENHKKLAERFDVALNNIVNGVAMFSPDGTITVASRKFLEFTGKKAEELIGKNVSELSDVKIGTTTHKNLGDKLSWCLKGKEEVQFAYSMQNKGTIEGYYNPMVDGGVVLLSDVSERIASEKAIRKLASFDPLTSLPNRRHFISELEANQSKDGKLLPCAMFFVDLDKFKEVNDTLGHAVGDKLLRMFAARLQAMLPEESYVCRFGDDEFVVVVPDMQNESDCQDLAQNIINEASLPVVIEGNQLKVGATIGIALAPKDGDTADQLLQYTDSALYDAKARGRSTYTFYSEELRESIKFRRELEMDMREALRAGQFDVYYQPLVNLRSGEIVTCEALLRWRHPKHGDISPGIFVQLAEESGLITRLGEFVLRKATEDCMTWPSNVRVGVNVSSIQFSKSDLVSLVTQVLEKTNLPAHRLEIEVTETAMLNDIEEATDILNRLTDSGVRISLDDFGTGFSSLSYLHTLPFDKVKIDRSFVENGLSDERTLTLLQGVVNLIKSLGLDVVVEGIEREDQIKALMKDLDVDEVQGFLFARPMPGPDILELLEASNKHKNVGQMGALKFTA